MCLSGGVWDMRTTWRGTLVEYIITASVKDVKVEFH